MEIDFLAVFLIGLLGGFSHCIGMCGGFVVSYTFKINENEFIERPGFLRRLTPHLMYSSGRILTYMLLGEIFGFLGGSLQVIFTIRDFQGYLQLFAGLVMVFMGLDLAGLIPKLAPDSFPGINAFKRLIHNLFNKVNRRNVFGLGFVLGFIPCGLVYAVGAKAAATGSILGGMLTMLFFGLGTLPAMVLTGLAAHLISAKLRSHIYKVAALMVIVLGVITVLRGLDVLGYIFLSF
ncbi:MAG TPA: sulfite exporter TauE/SafE family protein [Calditrichaeota bacterium]|nr:sulfite exporter TauE/SafE family protein [Calditrichota bacterium]